MSGGEPAHKAKGEPAWEEKYNTDVESGQFCSFSGRRLQ